MYYIGYVRVSSILQVKGGVSLEAQEERIKEWAKQNGVDVVIMREEGRSAKGSSLRPVYYEAMQKALSDPECAGIVAYSISRVGRSTTQLINDIETLEKAGKKLILLEENVDRSTATGRLVFSILSSIAQFEIEQMRERLAEGYRYYREHRGKVGRKKITLSRLNNPEDFKKLVKMGASYSFLRKTFKVNVKGEWKTPSLMTIRNLVKEVLDAEKGDRI